ncbi:MAG: lipopolysaccharide assembly protein LapB [Endozoicomonadaceae bacterium]|nr:lipopolysaccharide assembly protein LapB [Endozoicomonadaceae bacterium]
MFDPLLLLLILVSMLAGFFLGNRQRKQHRYRQFHNDSLNGEYFVGLNYLLNEQTDEAIESFIKALEINVDTIDTYIVLGRLFRRRGELDKAIHTHQDLLARPSLTREQSLRVQLELAHDYVKAGLLDRGESLLEDMLKTSWSGSDESVKLILSVYEQEKEWQKAIDIIRLVQKGGGQYNLQLAHYYCELAEVALESNDVLTARKNIRIACARDCVRATLLLGRLECSMKNYRESARVLQRIYQQNPVFISESIPLLEHSFDALWSARGLSVYLEKCLREYPSTAVVLASARLVARQKGDQEAGRFIVEQIVKRPSLKGLSALIDLNIHNSEARPKQNLILLRELTECLLATKPVYRCSYCGFDGKALHWCCPKCHEWGKTEPIMGVEGE